jgi:hypothetical protein
MQQLWRGRHQEMGKERWRQLRLLLSEHIFSRRAAEVDLRPSSAAGQGYSFIHCDSNRMAPSTDSPRHSLRTVIVG